MLNIGGVNIQDSFGYNGHSWKTEPANTCPVRALELDESTTKRWWIPQDSEDEGKTNMGLQHKGLEDDFPFSKGLMFSFLLFSMLVFGSVKLLSLLWFIMYWPRSHVCFVKTVW